MPQINLDVMRYAVACGSYRQGRLSEVYWPERHDDEMSHAATVEAIRTGLLERVVAVIEFNAAEGTARDVTEDFAREIAGYAYNHHLEVSTQVADFIEHHTDVRMTHGLEIV